MRIDCFFAFAMVLLLIVPAGGADAEDYARAEQFLPQSVVPALYNVSVEPHWIGTTSSFRTSAMGGTGQSSCW